MVAEHLFGISYFFFRFFFPFWRNRRVNWKQVIAFFFSSWRNFTGITFLLVLALVKSAFYKIVSPDLLYQPKGFTDRTTWRTQFSYKKIIIRNLINIEFE